MKTRVIVAAVGIPLIVLLICFAPVWVIGILMALICGTCAWEILRCMEPDIPMRLRVFTVLIAGLIPLFQALIAPAAVLAAGFFLLFAGASCELMLSFRKERTMDYETVTAVLLAGGVMPTLLSAVVRLDLPGYGSAYALLPFAISFSCDGAAYFAGMFFGRHKLAPRLSAHKTIEGSVGGFLGSIIVLLIYGLILKAAGYTVNFIVLAVYGFLGAVACQLGDLSFSAVKRLCDVKDFGNLIPGHGGMLDRFDSMHWVAVLTELLILWVPAVTK